jgi:hypothetical protein
MLVLALQRVDMDSTKPRAFIERHDTVQPFLVFDRIGRGELVVDFHFLGNTASGARPPNAIG